MNELELTPLKLQYDQIAVKFLEYRNIPTIKGRIFITMEIWISGHLVYVDDTYSPAPKYNKNPSDMMADFCTFLCDSSRWEDRENYALSIWAMTTPAEYLNILGDIHLTEFTSDFLELLSPIK